MKWEFYNKLTVKQKEELNYLFPTREIPRTSLAYFFGIIACFIIMSMSYLLCMKDIIPVPLLLNDVYIFILNVTRMGVIVWAGEYLISWIYFCYQMYKKYKWVKERIPTIKWHQC